MLRFRIEPLQSAPLGRPLRLDKVRGRQGRGAERADLAAVHQVRQDGEGFLEVRVGIGAVDLVHVDVVGLQSSQRILDGGGDPAPRGALVVRVVIDRSAHLRGQDHVVTAALECPSHDVFGVSVGVSGVHQVDPGVERLVDDADRLLGVVAHRGGEHHRAEPVRTDLDAGSAEIPVLHGSLQT